MAVLQLYVLAKVEVVMYDGSGQMEDVFIECSFYECLLIFFYRTFKERV